MRWTKRMVVRGGVRLTCQDWGGPGVPVMLLHGLAGYAGEWDHVAEKLGKFTRPKYVTFTQELPKTRSGKIMRRLLRDIAEGRTLGDTTTLADSAVVHELAARAEIEAH